ncbi:type II methionyl aminopeptidase [Methanolapillus ohkumae]|uniref:Methionine aminopeptidase n=1 Tax=Methanolapillus ohkumae TaxID=3028298 RepID=A0AA96VGU5_9EURY|nr:Methionine aminopeptidase [Methanosarcinaceae archaeon Am2]
MISQIKKSKNTEEILDKYRAAGLIHHQVMADAREKIKTGLSLYEYAVYIDRRIIELGGQSAFPVNISLNADAAHDTPLFEDTRVFGNDVVKVDVGVHVDGYIADGAMTIDLSGKNAALVKASEEALKAAIDTAKAGIGTNQIGAAIEDMITALGFSPIRNLMGHGLSQYTTHAEPSIPNCRFSREVILNAGDTIAIEPFATDGMGYVDNGSIKEIYSRISKKSTRLPIVRKVLDQIDAYHGLPFAKRWLTSEKLDFSLNQLEREGILTSYPVLVEVAGGLVSQAEHTLIITEDGCEVTTKM